MPTMSTPPPFERSRMLTRLRTETFDVLVVGGGITGVGVALDAVSRGLRTALVERDDFASGTSSKSSKMVHGGLRYLQQGDVRLVYEALRERQRLRRNAPHLVSVLPFMIPILGKPAKPGVQPDSVVPRKIARALGSAMWMYDLTGGWRIGKLHRRLRARAALAHLPTMPADRVLAAYLYFDAAVDDARLVLQVARTAAARGAAVANRCGVVEVSRGADGRVDGVMAEADGERFAIRARTVVNAAGVWSDDVRALDEGQHPHSIRPAKGVHVVVPWHKVRNDIAVVIPVPKDKRSLFLVPWGPLPDGTFRHCYIGTTDTDFTGALDDPPCDADDLAYVLRAVNASVDPAQSGGITLDDVTGVWAGLRPLVKAATAEAGGPDATSARTADLSRRHLITTSSDGLITVTGGKLTTYREMAEDTVDAVLSALGRSGRCRTRRLALIGAARSRAATGTTAHHLHTRHGAAAAEIEALVAARPELGEPLVPGLPYLAAEVVWAARHEMATTLDDVLTRRTRARLFDRAAALAAAPRAAELMAGELGWVPERVAAEIADFTARCDAELAAAGIAAATAEGAPP
jgi:glycerol-3-phosphate dehydrogenase